MVVLLALFWVHGDASSKEKQADGKSALIGIDHMPTVVADLEKASDSFRRLGFSLKPGRVHENGLRNNHIKFKDGSGIELISVPDMPNDAMTQSYSEQLREGEGPAYIAFHARNTEAFIAALKAANIQHKNNNGLITLTDPQLSFIFFVKDNRSPSDRPEHFAHSNGAIAMTEVWLALDGTAFKKLRKLLLSLGSIERAETVMAPVSTRAPVFYLLNGRVLVVPKRRQLIFGREIIGARFHVQNGQSQRSGSGSTDTIIQPSIAYGQWLRLTSQP